jgi:hypothetical protein
MWYVPCFAMARHCVRAANMKLEIWALLMLLVICKWVRICTAITPEHIHTHTRGTPNIEARTQIRIQPQHTINREHSQSERTCIFSSWTHWRRGAISAGWEQPEFIYSFPTHHSSSMDSNFHIKLFAGGASLALYLSLSFRRRADGGMFCVYWNYVEQQQQSARRSSSTSTSPDAHFAVHKCGFLYGNSSTFCKRFKIWMSI